LQLCMLSCGVRQQTSLLPPCTAELAALTSPLPLPRPPGFSWSCSPRSPRWWAWWAACASSLCPSFSQW
jgi:hypothetical protein